MAVAAGLAFGAALAVYLLSHFDGRVKKHHALAAFVVAFIVAIADAASSQTAVQTVCTESSPDGVTTTATCRYVYASDPTAVVLAFASAVFALLALVEMSAEKAADALWP